MPKFAIYQLMFSPIRFIEGDLFDEVDGHKSWNNKQDELQSLFDSKVNLRFKKNADEDYEREILHSPENSRIIAIRLANKRTRNLEKNFHNSPQKYSPSSLILIDNREGVQRIAIEKRQDAFASTDTVANILQDTFRRCLQDKGLSVDIKPKVHSKEFWNLTKRFKHQIVYLKFNLLHPNLPDLTNLLDEFLETARDFNCNPSYECNALPEQTLTINESSIRIQNMVDACAAVGQPIQVKTSDGQKFECFVHVDEDQIVEDTCDITREMINNLDETSKSYNTFHDIGTFLNRMKLFYE